MKKSTFTLFVSGLMMAGLMQAALPAAGASQVARADEEPGGADWYLVESNRMSGVTAEDVDDEGVTIFFEGGVISAQPDEAGAIFEGEPYSMAISNPWEDYLEYETYIEEPGRYKFSYRLRAYKYGVSGGGAEPYVDLHLYYRTIAGADNTVSDGHRLYSTTELPADVYGSDEFEVTTAGTYVFGIMVDVSNDFSYEASLYVGDFNLYQWRESAPEVKTYELTWEEPENGTLTVTGPEGELTPGSAVDEGTKVTITATPDEGFELESLTVNGEDFESGASYTVNEATVIAAAFVEEGGGEPGEEKTWWLVMSNDLSGTSQDEVETEGVTATIGSVVEGGVLEGLPWSWALQDSWPGDNFCLQVEVEEAGTYKFSYRARLAVAANSQASIDADLRYGTPGTSSANSTVVSDTYNFTQSDELPGTLMESNEFELQPGTYNFYVNLFHADYTSSGSTFCVGDFQLYQLREGEQPVSYTVTYTVDNADLAEVAVLDAATMEPVASGSLVADGTKLLVTAEFTNHDVVGEIMVDGEPYDEFDYESCSGSYTNEGNEIVVSKDVNIAIALDVVEGLSDGVADGVKVYPTRFVSDLTVEVPTAGEACLYDMAGAKVFSATVESGVNVLGLDGLDRGLYLLQLSDGTTTQVVRVVKE